MFTAVMGMKDELLGIVRHVLTTLGGGLVAGGYLTESELGMVVGAITALIGIGLSLWDKMKRRTPAPPTEVIAEEIDAAK